LKKGVKKEIKLGAKGKILTVDEKTTKNDVVLEGKYVPRMTSFRRCYLNAIVRK
jgi:hypothetical protein